ncbi:MAG: FHA domain-containing protein [Rudaea sp.]|uniref:FHA domain-containing protein n=1 Tax=Rudaea sp. TaxID=2136325 RepID=UPI0039E5A9C3
MRISFPNKEQEDTLVGAGEARIGAAADNTIVIGGSGVAAHHLSLKSSERGIELTVLDAGARTHVNTRPVREKAMLRLGDVISLGGVQFVLKPDRDADICSAVPPPSVLPESDPVRPPRVLLRGLSGTHFGKIVPVRGRLVVGSGNLVDLDLDGAGTAARHAAIEFAGETIVLRDLGAGGATRVDGIEVRDAILYAGDQICFGHERFLVEAPGLPARPSGGVAMHRPADPTITQTMQAITPPSDAAPAPHPGAERRAPDAGRNDIWWLIAVAALIAAGTALLFSG